MSLYEAQISVANVAHRHMLAQEAHVKVIGHRSHQKDGRRFTCNVADCQRSFKRPADLRRHNDSRHDEARRGQFKCRADVRGGEACQYVERGFPRKDKRDEHERAMHKWTKDMQSLIETE